MKKLLAKNASVKLIAPWAEYYHEVKALFGDDPEIKIEYDDNLPEVKIYVENAEKAAALTQLLPTEKIYGRIVLKITVIPANNGNQSLSSVYEAAFTGNPAFSYMETVEGILSNPISFLVFKNKVVQYYNDDLGDINGYRSTLYQDIAKDLFENTDGVFFCTDKPEEEK